MEITLTLLVVVAILAGICNAQDSEESESIIERTFRRMHYEPPPPPPSAEYRSEKVRTLWIQQKLDHFDPEDKRTWDMRYMANDQCYKEGGPLFIFVGGEWDISAGTLMGGHMFDMAKEHNGYMFYTEHRYYGKSKPTSDLTTENLKYLHVRQALADLAHFITVMKATIPGMANSKVILVGGSYSATMVTWFKKLYPDLATGCWASSAPLFAKVDFFEYNEVATESIALLGGEKCVQRIKRAVEELEDMFANKRGAEVKAMLKICNDFDDSNDMDISSLFSTISNYFAGTAQTHRNNTIQNMCEELMEGEDDLISIVKYMGLHLTRKCNDFTYKSMITSLKETKFSSGIWRQWIYQTCNEYGWFSTSNSKRQPFGTKFPASYHTARCADIYGAQFTSEYVHKQIDETNEFFGGLSPSVENVFMTHGQLDPWRAMGIQNETQATIITMHSHCADFGSLEDTDTAEMRAAKEKIAELVRQWIA